MSRRNKNQNSNLSKEIRQVVRQEDRKHKSLSSWIHQEGLKQEMVTLHDVFFVDTPALAGVQSLNNECVLNCNGYRAYAADSSLPDFLPPQRMIWNTYAAMYKYYMVESYSLSFVPARLQISTSTTGNYPVAQFPTLMNTLPTYVTHTPQTSYAGLNLLYSYMSARKKPKIVKGFDTVSFTVHCDNNLLLRQSSPMLLTNGQWVSREKYENDAASTIKALVFSSFKDRFPIGLCEVTIKYRFAGLFNPTESSVVDLTRALLAENKLSDLVSTDPQVTEGHMEQSSRTALTEDVHPRAFSQETYPIQAQPQAPCGLEYEIVSQGGQQIRERVNPTQHFVVYREQIPKTGPTPMQAASSNTLNK